MVGTTGPPSLWSVRPFPRARGDSSQQSYVNFQGKPQRKHNTQRNLMMANLVLGTTSKPRGPKRTFLRVGGDTFGIDSSPGLEVNFWVLWRVFSSKKGGTFSGCSAHCNLQQLDCGHGRALTHKYDVPSSSIPLRWCLCKLLLLLQIHTFI